VGADTGARVILWTASPEYCAAAALCCWYGTYPCGYTCLSYEDVEESVLTVARYADEAGAGAGAGAGA
jgi:hypothetical protein